MKDQQIHKYKVWRNVIKWIFCPLDLLFDIGKLPLCAACWKLKLYSSIDAWTSNIFEGIHLHAITEPHYLMWVAQISLLGEQNSTSWQLRDHWLYFQKMILITQGDEGERQEARQYLEDRAVTTSEGVFCHITSISPMTIILPNSVYIIYHGMLKHFMDWVISFLKQLSTIVKFSKLWAMIPSYPDFAQFNKPHCEVTQSSGEVIEALGHIIVPMFAVTLLNPFECQRIPFSEALLCVKNLANFHLIAQYLYHTKPMIENMEKHLDKFHYNKYVSSRFHACISAMTVMEALKMQHTLDKLEDLESDPAWSILGAAAKRRRIDEDTMLIKSEIVQHLVEVSDVNLVNMHYLNHHCDHNHPLGNLLYAHSEFPEITIMDLEQAYQ